MQATTINRRLATLRSLTKFARLVGWIVWKLEIPGLKTQTYRDTSGPRSNAYRRMLSRVDLNSSRKTVRDCAILRLLHDLGSGAWPLLRPYAQRNRQGTVFNSNARSNM